MFAIFFFTAFVIAFLQQSEGFAIGRLHSLRTYRADKAIFCVSETPKDTPKDSVGDSEMKQVTKGLTHIKYNKYAPSAEEAAGMTDEQFRGTIFRRMVSCRTSFM